MPEENKSKKSEKPDAEFVNTQANDFRVVYSNSFVIFEMPMKDGYEISFNTIRPYIPKMTPLEEFQKGAYREIETSEEKLPDRFERRFEVSVIISKEKAKDLVEWFKKRFEKEDAER